MWIKLANGRVELVVNEDHIQRLLSEGCMEVSDPRLVPTEQPEETTEQQQESEQADGSALDNGESDSEPAQDDQRPIQRKSKVRGSRVTR
jgi:hypothetical protein